MVVYYYFIGYYILDSKQLWPESSPLDSNGKKLAIEQRSREVSDISATRPRPPRHYQTVGKTSEVYYPP